jgi:type IV pilus assembly protein PilN
MIRVNLLSGERDRAKRRVAAAGPNIGQKLIVVCSLLLVATLVGIGWWFWSLRQESARMDADVAAARRETERLKSVLDEVRVFEARRTQLEQRVTLIEQLRRGQSGPVHMLDQISRSLPDRLWLTTLEQKGVDLTIEGRATSLTSLSDFIGNLETSGYFRRPVEIVDSQVENAAQGDLIRFTVRAQFQAPGT